MATRVRQLQMAAGPDRVYRKGDVWIAGDDEARRLAEAGIAEILQREEEPDVAGIVAAIEEAEGAVAGPPTGEGDDSGDTETPEGSAEEETAPEEHQSMPDPAPAPTDAPKPQRTRKPGTGGKPVETASSEPAETR